MYQTQQVGGSKGLIMVVWNVAVVFFDEARSQICNVCFVLENILKGIQFTVFHLEMSEVLRICVLYEKCFHHKTLVPINHFWKLSNAKHITNNNWSSIIFSMDGDGYVIWVDGRSTKFSQEAFTGLLFLIIS